MAHDVARTIVSLAAADQAKDLATMLQRRSFTLELNSQRCSCFAVLNFGFDGRGMVHASLRRYGASAFSTMVVPEGSLEFLVDCAFKLGNFWEHPMEEEVWSGRRLYQLQGCGFRPFLLERALTLCSSLVALMFTERPNHAIKLIASLAAVFCCSAATSAAVAAARSGSKRSSLMPSVHCYCNKPFTSSQFKLVNQGDKRANVVRSQHAELQCGRLSTKWR